MEFIPPRLKEPVYRVYEMRLRQDLTRSKSQLPRHIAVLCDGNRRWARDAGYDDVSVGYRRGAAKIAEMLRWCQDAGIEMATVYLLSTENLQRDPDELAALIEIITDVVEEICAPANRWSVRTVGDLSLLGEEPARRLRQAVEGTVPTTATPGRRRRSTSTSPSRTAVVRRSSMPSELCSTRNWPTASPANNSSNPSPPKRFPKTSTPRDSPIRIW